MSMSIGSGLSIATMHSFTSASGATSSVSLNSSSSNAIGSTVDLNSKIAENLLESLDNIGSEEFIEDASEFVQQSIILNAALSMDLQANTSRDLALHLLKD